jgi:hypothetical protein
VASRFHAPSPGEASDVELIPAGNVTDVVARVGGTIRRPHHDAGTGTPGFWIDAAALKPASSADFPGKRAWRLCP